MPSEKQPTTALELLALGIELLDGKKGDTGERGEKGDTGERGEKGERGTDGKDGVNGKDGRDGVDGKDGRDGKDGKQGPKGDIGPQGPAGKDGKDAEVTPALLIDVTTPIIVQNVQKAVASKTVSADEVDGLLEFVQENGGGPGGASAWGDITGTLSDQTDLQSALDGKSGTGHTHTGVYAPALGVDDNYVTDAEKTKLANLSGTNTGDQDLSGYSLTSHNHTGVYEPADATILKDADIGVSVASQGHNHTGVYAPALGADDNYVTDAEKVVIGNTSGTNTGDNATNSQYSGLATSKQDALVSGTNIKTVNGSSVLGSGNLAVVDDTAYGVSWNGDTTTAPSKNAVYDKIETLSAGSGLTAPQVASLISIRF